MLRKPFGIILAAAVLALVGTAVAAPTANTQKNARAIERLNAELGGDEASISPATETANFVRLPKNGRAAASATSQESEATAFIRRHATAFGLRVGSDDLKLRKSERDALGRTHLSYTQEYAGVPVFGASLKAHFDKNGELDVISGTLVPDIDLSTAPSISAEAAADQAIRWVKNVELDAVVDARQSRLLVFREGLAKGVPGANHLAYEVEVGNGVNVREFVYIDAHSGKLIDQITGTPDALNRRAYDGEGGDFAHVLTIWPNSPFWVEGDPLPTADPTGEADNMIISSQETYDFFANAFGRDSFDGAGGTMDSIFNRGYSCPNASWNGVFISFCPGLTSDDVTGHEWGHAYTDYTDDLIYQWQPGALNESYSDVVGETVDRINGRDVIGTDGPRTPGSCSALFGAPPPTLTIEGGSAAGSYFARASVNEPPAPFTIGPLPLVHAEPADACAAITNDVAGKIVIVDWEINGAPSRCGSGGRAANSINAGAAGILFVAPASGLLNLGSNAAIGSVEVFYSDGEAIKAGLPANATMDFQVGVDNSARWLVGEDVNAPGLVGALRDMWTPGCFGDPGKVSDAVYSCDLGQADNGGVHSNSGIPNHAFALLVDGGSFNGQNINAIGLTKANHILFRAKTHYQGPATDFAGHADAIEQSCADLVGTDLASLTDGTPSGEVVSAADCAEVSKAIAAVELRTPPSQCGFQPLLAQNPPPLCEAGSEHASDIFMDGFERRHGPDQDAFGRANNNGQNRTWRITHDAVTPPDFTNRDWLIVSDLPDGREGSAFFGADPTYGTCGPGGDESAVLHLDSPKVAIPQNASDLRLAFDHWIATENGWDGANIKISVNNGPWAVVAPEAFVYNPYNLNFVGWNFIIPAQFGNTNPLAGEFGFSGTDQGAVDGSWGQSIIDLNGYAQPGDTIQLRFDIGNDGCGGAFGWYVDDVRVYECR